MPRVSDPPPQVVRTAAPVVRSRPLAGSALEPAKVPEADTPVRSITGERSFVTVESAY